MLKWNTRTPSPGKAVVRVPVLASASGHASVHLNYSINGKLRTYLVMATTLVSTLEPTQPAKFNFLQRSRDLTLMSPPLRSPP